MPCPVSTVRSVSLSSKPLSPTRSTNGDMVSSMISALVDGQLSSLNFFSELRPSRLSRGAFCQSIMLMMSLILRGVRLVSLNEVRAPVMPTVMVKLLGYLPSSLSLRSACR